MISENFLVLINGTMKWKITFSLMRQHEIEKMFSLIR